LRFFTRLILKKYEPDVIGIAGSVGKRGLKKLVVKVLNTKFRVAGNPDAHNNEFGLPLAVIGVVDPGRSIFGWCKVFLKAVKLILRRDKKYPEVLVLEMLASKPGDLKHLTSMAPCKVGVVTSLNEAYLEYFKTLKKLGQELRLMISTLDKNSFAVLNRDEEDIFVMGNKTEADIFTFGFHPEADVRASDILFKKNEDDEVVGVYFKISYHGSMVPMYLFDAKKQEDVYPALAGIVIALVMGLNLVEISEVLKEV
ncbi:MAG: Mur ligase family protein, partial [Candidatus Magasanikiibacteriota bacterium]